MFRFELTLKVYFITSFFINDFWVNDSMTLFFLIDIEYYFTFAGRK